MSRDSGDLACSLAGYVVRNTRLLQRKLERPMRSGRSDVSFRDASEPRTVRLRKAERELAKAVLRLGECLLLQARLGLE